MMKKTNLLAILISEELKKDLEITFKDISRSKMEALFAIKYLETTMVTVTLTQSDTLTYERWTYAHSNHSV